jgi:hypothetical protein
MKLSIALVGLASVGSVSAFTVPFGSKVHRSKSTLSMVLEKPAEKKLAKIESLKVVSDHLINPLKEVRLLLALKRALVVVQYRTRSDDFNLSPSDRYMRKN